MLFSIVVPIYNSEKFLENCINSILSQTFDKYEVLLINDGSTDNSEKICKKFITNKKIRLLALFLSSFFNSVLTNYIS